MSIRRQLAAQYRSELSRAERTVARLEAELAEARARLNDRQRRFCDLTNGPPPWGRAYRAAEAAGYACPRVQGPRLASMAKVRAVLALTLDLWCARRKVRDIQEAYAECRAELSRPLPPLRRRARGRRWPRVAV